MKNFISKSLVSQHKESQKTIKESVEQNSKITSDTLSLGQDALKKELQSGQNEMKSEMVILKNEMQDIKKQQNEMFEMLKQLSGSKAAE